MVEEDLRDPDPDPPTERAKGDVSTPEEQFCFNCEDGTDKTDLKEVLPGWVFVEPLPDSSMNSSSPATSFAQIRLGQEAETSPSTIEIVIPDEVR